MKTRILNAKIACLDINLQKTRMQLGVQILVEDPNQLEEIRKRFVISRIKVAVAKRYQHPVNLRLLWNEFEKFWRREQMLFSLPRALTIFA